MQEKTTSTTEISKPEIAPLDKKEVRVLLSKKSCPKSNNDSSEALAKSSTLITTVDEINPDEYVLVPGPIYVPRSSVMISATTTPRLRDDSITYSVIHKKADEVKHITSYQSTFLKDATENVEAVPQLPELKSQVIKFFFTLYKIVPKKVTKSALCLKNNTSTCLRLNSQQRG